MKLSLLSEADIPLTTSYDSATRTLVKNDCTLITKALMDAGYEQLDYYGRPLCYHDPHFGSSDVSFIKYIASARRGDNTPDNAVQLFTQGLNQAFEPEGRTVEVTITKQDSHVHVFQVTVSKP